MAAPETHITWDDQSAIPAITFPEDGTDYPVFLTVLTSDKGPEGWQQNIDSKTFYKLYGQPSFKKHGQCSIQAANIVDSGGKLVVKRVVASDSTLANISIVAHVGLKEMEATDEQGNIMWLKSDGTTEFLAPGTTPQIHVTVGDEETIQDDDRAETGIANALEVWFSMHTVQDQSSGNTYTQTKDEIYQSIYSLHNSSKPFTLTESDTSDMGDDDEEDEGFDIDVQQTQYVYDKSNLPTNLTSLGKSDLLNPEQGYKSINHYLLFTVCDNGRGISNKTFRIYRDASRSAPVLYTKYFLEISENGSLLETISFTMNPDIIEKNNSASLEDSVFRNSKQVTVKFYDDEFNKFTEFVSESLTMDGNEYALADCLFGKDNRGYTYQSKGKIGTNMCTFTIHEKSPVDLSSIFGIPLQSGTNGELGDNPIELFTSSSATTATQALYSNYLESAFNFTLDDNDTIYDIDNVRVDAVFDANYPNEVKECIENFVTFREDCMFFRDYGTEIYTLADIVAYEANNSLIRNRFISSYVSAYEIYDPYTKKHIAVTMTYHLAALFVNHFINGRTRPFCGQKYSVIIPTQDYIPGSLRFSPKTLPTGVNVTNSEMSDEKDWLDTRRLNYCKFYDGKTLTVASEYTSQEEYTQLSFINNVLAVQEVIKAIRSVCPKIRYSFIDAGSDDFTRYKDDIDELIISKYANRFKTCEIEYMTDDIYTLNKIIYAVIRVRFRDFVQTEYFKITALI